MPVVSGNESEEGEHSRMTTGHAFSPRCAGARCVQHALFSGLSCCPGYRRSRSPQAALRPPCSARPVHVISSLSPKVRPDLCQQRTIARAEHGRCASRSKRRRAARDNQLSKQPDGDNDRRAPVCLCAALALL